MSIDLGREPYIDCDGPDCRHRFMDGDEVFCSGCSDHIHLGQREAAHIMTEWLRANKSWIGGREQRFLEEVAERMSDNRPAVANMGWGS